MENGALIANNIPIFPSTLSTDMHLPALRHWSSKASRETENVHLTYALHTQRVPPRAQGKLYRFTMDLFDQQNRPATTDTVSLTLVRNAEEKLLLSSIRVEPAVHHAQRWKLKYWKTQVGGYMVTVKEAVKSRLQGESSMDKVLILDGNRGSSAQAQDLDSNTEPSIRIPSEDGSRFQILSFYQFTHYPSHHAGNQRHFLRLVRPIILPALLGIMAGLVACVIGFLVGRIGASVYFHMQGQRQTGSVSLDVEEGFVSEKQRLLEMYE